MACTILCGWLAKKFLVKLGACVFAVLSYGNPNLSNIFAIDLANGKSLPEVRNIIPMPIITAENVSQFKGEW